MQWLWTTVYLHGLITYSSTKCMKMLPELFPIQTNSLISFHHQYSVLLHRMYYFQRTTCRCPLCRHNWECITQPHINPSPFLLLLNVVIILVHLWLFMSNSSWTRKTTTLQSNNNTHVNKKISQFMYINLFVVVVVVVTMSFCSFSYVTVDAKWQMNNNNIITHEQQEQAQ